MSVVLVRYFWTPALRNSKTLGLDLRYSRGPTVPGGSLDGARNSNRKLRLSTPEEYDVHNLFDHQILNATLQLPE